MSNRLVSSKPFQISADEAAKRISHGLEQNQPIIAFPVLLALVTRFSQFMPAGLRRWLAPSFRINAEI